MARGYRQSIALECPECGSDVDDIDLWVTPGTGREFFWGAPVSTDETEVEIEGDIPKCPECGHQSSETDVLDEFERVAW